MKTMKLALVAALMGLATPAMAIFDAQVMLGKRWYDLESDGETTPISGQEIGLAAHIDPIPLVPVAFGASIAMIDLKEEDYYPADAKSASVFEPSLEVMAWLPMVPVVTPYARLKIPVMAKYTLETDDGTDKSELVGNVSGYHLNAGIKWSPLPIVKLLVEVGMGSETLKVDELKVNGTKYEGDIDDGKANSKAFLVGVEIGL